MDDLRTESATSAATGRRTSRSSIAPLFVLPPRPKAFLKWLPHYFLPWNLLFALSAVAYWAWIIPPVETMRTLTWGWPLWLYAVNAVAVFLFYGAFELHLYVLKRQERRFKYNGKFPSEQKSKAFWFESQNLDNILRTFLSGVTIWTAVEVAGLVGIRQRLRAVAELRRASRSTWRRSPWSCRSSTSSTSSASTG